MFAVQADGYEITTIEGLAPAAGELSVVQDAFCETHGLQCGYCTPGMVLTAHALLEHNDAPSRKDIVEAISGNICRCTGYGQIIEAVEYAAERFRKANTRRATNHASATVTEPDLAEADDGTLHGVLESAEEASTPRARS
jgi:carbon-monoxide dehydrogenase small subunit